MSKEIRTITRPLYSVRGFTTARKTPPRGTHPVAALFERPPNVANTSNAALPTGKRLPLSSASWRRCIFAALDKTFSSRENSAGAASRARLRSSAESPCVKNLIPLRLRTDCLYTCSIGGASSSLSSSTDSSSSASTRGSTAGK